MRREEKAHLAKVLWPLPFLLVACAGTRHLSRDRAAEILGGAPFFSEGYREIEVVVGPRAVFEPGEMEEYQVLEKLGLVSIGRSELVSTIEVTKLGRERVSRSQATASELHKRYFFRVAQRKLVTVTGVATGEQGQAQVEFTWTWKPINEIGRSLRADATTYQAMTRFRLFDDGWRIEGTIAEPSATNPTGRRVEVCMGFHGSTSCGTASGLSEASALRAARQNACAQIASGVTDAISCEQTQPTRITWLN